MKLSIIIVSYNTKDLLKACIASIRKNTSKELLKNLEIIIIDNNSHDESVEAIQKKRNALTLRIIKNNSNLGFAKAVNQGIKKSKGEYILLLNSDTLIKENALKKLIDFAEKTKDAGVIGARLINSDNSIQPSCYNFPSMKNAFLEFWLNKKGVFSKYAPKTKKPVQVDALVGAVFLITSKALKKVGKLNEKYFMYFEDFDYCQRVREVGLKVYYLPEAEVIHEHGASGKICQSGPRGRRSASPTKQYLIKSSKQYNGLIKHYLINLIIWSGQKWQKIRF